MEYTIICSDGSLRVHEENLCKCDYFKSMIGLGGVEVQNHELKVECSVRTMSNIISFTTGTLTNIDITEELLEYSHLYDITELVEACKREMIRNPKYEYISLDQYYALGITDDIVVSLFKLGCDNKSVKYTSFASTFTPKSSIWSRIPLPEIPIPSSGTILKGLILVFVVGWTSVMIKNHNAKNLLMSELAKDSVNNKHLLELYIKK